MPADLTSPAFLALAWLILIVALLYSTVGHAGASGYLAAMALMGEPDDVMRPTALVLNVLVSIIGTIQFARAGHFSWRLFWPFAATSVPMAFIAGGYKLPAMYYTPFVGLVLLFSSWRMLMSVLKGESPATNEAPSAAAAPVHPPQVWVGLSWGAFLGFISGLTGVGGGIFLSPLILLCGWADPKKTGAVSAAFILVNSAAGLSGYYKHNHQIPTAAPALGVCAVLGGLVGSYLGSRKFDSRTLRMLLAVVLLIAGAKLLTEIQFHSQPAPTPAPAATAPPVP